MICSGEFVGWSIFSDNREEFFRLKNWFLGKHKKSVFTKSIRNFLFGKLFFLVIIRNWLFFQATTRNFFYGKKIDSFKRLWKILYEKLFFGGVSRRNFWVKIYFLHRFGEWAKRIYFPLLWEKFPNKRLRSCQQKLLFRVSNQLIRVNLTS